MSPDWARPDAPVPPRRCVTCDVAIPEGRIRCDRCRQAAETAVREITGRHVLPSDIQRILERMGEDDE